MNPSFSHRLKKELIDRLHSSSQPEASNVPPDLEGWDAISCDLTYIFILLTHASFGGGRLRVQSSHVDLLESLKQWVITSYSDDRVLLSQRGQRHYLTVEGDTYARLTLDLQERLGFDTARGRMTTTAEELGDHGRRALLRALFMTQGSMANPRRAYQLELVIRRRNLVPLIQDALRLSALDYQVSPKPPHVYLYIKNGDQIALFLAWIGSQQGVLAYENIRAERELRGQVNRQVNFDSANLSKIARSAAQQHAAIQTIREAGIFDQLPEDLAEVAKARERHPYDSLQELGESLDPKVGKSGVRHRLNRIIKMAEQIQHDE